MTKKKSSPTRATARFVHVPGPPKHTHQGTGSRSLPKRGRKPYRGQGR
jgi:hypothetical protein